ncbi:hypothetical protein F5Y13DRAFT_175814 [Hypoxylon sp. FL1857]|nr:hypothetical protein F5Y13DRAFT_175814 [Hypoxylon sp. FL1857]
MSTLLYLVLNICLVLAQDNREPDENNHFIYPPLPGPQYSNDPSVFEKNLNFTVGKGQSQPFKWVSNMTSMQIILCQEGNPDSVRTHDITDCIDGTSTDYVYWDGGIGSIDLKNGSQAYLGVWNCSDFTTPVFFSHYMNLVEDPSASSTTTSSSSAATAVSTSSSSSIATEPVVTPPTSTDSPPTDESQSSSGSSNAAAIGGGIGGGIGGALILIAAAFAFWKYRSAKNQKQQQPAQQIAAWANHQDYNAMSMSPGSNVYKPPYQPSELESHPPSVSELPPGSEQRRVYEMSGSGL